MKQKKILSHTAMKKRGHFSGSKKNPAATAPQLPFIAGSLLSANPLQYGEALKKFSNGGCDWIHIDVMDGSFVPPITFGDALVSAAASKTILPLDVHLMIQRPEDHVATFAQAGSHCVTFHYEATPHVHRVLGMIKQFGCRAGIAINPATPVEVLYDILELADLVLIMTVNPGWGGQSFIQHSIERIKKLHDEIARQGTGTLIEVDGGINERTGPLCAKAGADILVSGSYLFNSKDLLGAVKALRS